MIAACGMLDPMLADSLIIPECIYRPGSFSGLMTVYESNYIKWTQLIGDDFLQSGQYRSRSRRDCDLFLDVMRREPYTTTLLLTYRFELPDKGFVADPDLTLRVYHDARLVEAVCVSDCHHHHKLVELASAHSAELGRRWKVNVMFNKWLDYLLDMNHELLPA
jgi:uncharacterized protein